MIKKTLILSTALCGLALSAQAQDKEVNVVSWGGAYEKSQIEAYNKPFTEKTGIKVNMLAADNPATPLKAQIEAGNITGDVFDIEVADAIRLCDEGALVEINPDDLPPAPDGTPARDDFLPGAGQQALPDAHVIRARTQIHVNGVDAHSASRMAGSWASMAAITRFVVCSMLSPRRAKTRISARA